MGQTNVGTWTERKVADVDGEEREIIAEFRWFDDAVGAEFLSAKFADTLQPYHPTDLQISDWQHDASRPS